MAKKKPVRVNLSTPTVDIIDPKLADLAPLKRLPPPMVGSLGKALNSKVTEVFKVEK